MTLESGSVTAPALWRSDGTLALAAGPMQNPLASDDPDVWTSLVEAANPASLMVVIAARLGPELRSSIAPEDILQDTLLKAWRARRTVDWQGMASFRSWLLRIAERCVEDERDRVRAAKRGGGTAPSGRARSTQDPDSGLEPWSSTTPSRLAARREQMAAMEAALATLPDDVRDIVRERLFEDLLLEDIATRHGLGLSAVRHRFRKGAELYRQRLRAALGRSTTDGPTRAQHADSQGGAGNFADGMYDASNGNLR